jgi:hypothetical protein
MPKGVIWFVSLAGPAVPGSSYSDAMRGKGAARIRLGRRHPRPLYRRPLWCGSSPQSLMAAYPAQRSAPCLCATSGRQIRRAPRRHAAEACWAERYSQRAGRRRSHRLSRALGLVQALSPLLSPPARWLARHSAFPRLGYVRRPYIAVLPLSTTSCHVATHDERARAISSA